MQGTSVWLFCMIALTILALITPPSAAEQVSEGLVFNWKNQIAQPNDRCFWFANTLGVKLTEMSITTELFLVEIGGSGPVQVRDLWEGQDLGSCREKLVTEIPAHGAMIYKLL